MVHFCFFFIQINLNSVQKPSTRVRKQVRFWGNGRWGWLPLAAVWVEAPCSAHSPQTAAERCTDLFTRRAPMRSPKTAGSYGLPHSLGLSKEAAAFLRGHSHVLLDPGGFLGGPAPSSVCTRPGMRRDAHGRPADAHQNYSLPMWMVHPKDANLAPQWLARICSAFVNFLPWQSS